MNNDTTVTLHIGSEEEGKPYVKCNDKETVFRLFKSNLDRILKKSDILQAEEPPVEAETE